MPTQTTIDIILLLESLIAVLLSALLVLRYRSSRSV